MLKWTTPVLALALVLSGLLLSPQPSPAVDSEETAKAKKRSQENLQKIAVAFHKFHNDYNRLPFAYEMDKNKKPTLSWRVSILPYLGEEGLFNKFKLEEPWDSDHNTKLLTKMPKIFAPVTGDRKEDPVTYYQAFVTTGGKNCSVFGLSPKTDIGHSVITLSTITNSDGTSRTILVVEAGEPVAWTKPSDLEFNDDKELPKLGGLFGDGLFAAMCDGKVHWIKRGYDEKAMRWLIGFNDGKNVELTDEGDLKLPKR